MKKDSKNSEHGVFYTHGTDSNGKRFTLAAKEVDANHVQFGLAICNDKDNFCRKIGRTIAKARTMGRPLQVVEIVDAATEIDKRKIVMETMFKLKEKVKENVENFMVRNLSEE
jgi:hypothetical protein